MKVDGGFAEYVTVPRRNAYVFKKTSFYEASFLPNLNTVVYALGKTRFRPGDTILKVGAGKKGLLFVQVAKSAGPPLVVIIDKARNRLELAKEPGAEVALLADENQSSRSRNWHLTHTFPLSDFDKALEQAMRPHECIRVIVEP